MNVIDFAPIQRKFNSEKMGCTCYTAGEYTGLTEYGISLSANEEIKKMKEEKK